MNKPTELSLHDPADPIFLEIKEGSQVIVPDASALLKGSYSRQGPDLLISGDNGEQIYIIGFFSEPNPPDLYTENGARISAELATKLAGSATPGQYAQLGPSASPQPIHLPLLSLLGRLRPYLARLTLSDQTAPI